MAARRGVLLAILLTAVVAMFFLSRLQEVQGSDLDWRLGVGLAVVALIGAAGNRPAWGVAFVVSALAAALAWAVALTRMDEVTYPAVAAVVTIVPIALWGLKPAGEPVAPPLDQG
jgi:hypothetical protein